MKRYIDRTRVLVRAGKRAIPAGRHPQGGRGRVDTAFGYHLLQTGCSRGHALFSDSPINHRIYAAEQAGDQITLLASADELPLESDSVDTVIAQHTLDFAGNPHQVLRRSSAC